MTPREVDALNESICSSYEKPDCIVAGYRLWFRGYISSQHNDLLVGYWLAWPDDPYLPNRFFGSLCGQDHVFEYRPGEEFMPDRSLSLPTLASTEPELRAAKDEALQRLKDRLPDLV
jgi:hypothetical protein